MKVCAVICEYNPFHNGHKYHLAQARRETGADYLLCLMSGPFTQRGDAAIVDKWTRARCALLGGADLVLELPPAFAVRPAQEFARAGVAMAAGLGVVTHLAFGSENADLALLRGYAGPEGEETSRLVREALSQGYSHPKARALAGLDLPPNMILGVEYLRALEAYPQITPVAIPRLGGHHDLRLHAYASATAVREALLRGEEVDGAVPADSLPLLQAACARRGGYRTLAAYDQMLLYRLRAMTAQRLAAYPGIGEGLEHRFLAAAQQAGTIEQLLGLVKCKRYPLARLRRSLVQLLLGLDQAALDARPAPEYARVLGLRKAASPLLRRMKEQGRLPLLVKLAAAPRTGALRQDVFAQDIWALGAANPGARRAGQDFETSPVLL